MRWTQAEYDAYIAKESAAYRARCAASRAVAEPLVCYEPVAAKAREAGHADRFHVRIVSFRRRLCDPDNLCPKYFVDCARYAGFIPDDRAQDITLEVRQEKVKTKAEERTEITIDEPI